MTLESTIRGEVRSWMAVGAAAVVILAAAPAYAGDCMPYNNPIQSGTLLGADVDEASGLVASRNNRNIFWTHNDDANDNRVFALRADGAVVGTYFVGSGAQDPEDIALGPGPQAGVTYLYVGDIGDNNNTRSNIVIRRVPEPSVSADQRPVVQSLPGVQSITLAYPTDSTAPPHRDAETLLVDPVNADIYVITKREGVGRVYRAPAPHSTSGVTVMTYVASLPWTEPVGGDVSFDGGAIIVRRYSWQNPGASIWFRAPGTPLWEAFSAPRCDVALQSEPQGEAICFGPDTLDYYTVSENMAAGAQIPIWYFQESTPRCSGKGACDDGLFCNGVESCTGGRCVNGPLPCGAKLCSEAADSCYECETGAQCDDGLFCNGVEVCNGTNCVAGTPPCVGLFCVESIGCAHCLSDDHCNDFQFCNGMELCVDGDCTLGVPPCGEKLCHEDRDTCECRGGTDCLQACADQNGDGVRDDPCTWWAFVEGACQPTRVVRGDVGGAFGACAPDQNADNHDSIHVLNCFANQNLGQPGTTYPCEALAPTAFNVDAGGPFESCAPDGICDINDVFHVLSAFDGSTTCGCGGEPQPVAQVEPRRVRDVAVDVVPHDRVVSPGAVFEADIVMRGPSLELRGYQVHVRVRGGWQGHVDIVDLAIPTDRRVPGDRPSRVAFNIDTHQLLAYFGGARATLERGAALATVTLQASDDARGAFEIICLGNEQESQRTFLIGEDRAVNLMVRSTSAIVEVGRPAASAGRARRGA